MMFRSSFHDRSSLISKHIIFSIFNRQTYCIYTEFAFQVVIGRLFERFFLLSSYHVDTFALYELSSHQASWINTQSYAKEDKSNVFYHPKT